MPRSYNRTTLTKAISSSYLVTRKLGGNNVVSGRRFDGRPPEDCDAGSIEPMAEHSVVTRMLACHENVTVIAANHEQLRIKAE
jgi:hypothetical protein